MRRTVIAFLVAAGVGMAWAPSALATSCTYNPTDPHFDRAATLSISSGHTVRFSIGSTGAFVWLDETSNTASTCTGAGTTATKSNTDFLFLNGSSGNETLRMDDGGLGGTWVVSGVPAVNVDLGAGTDRVDVMGSAGADDYLFNRDSTGAPRLGTSSNAFITGLDNTELFQVEGFAGADKLAAQTATLSGVLSFTSPVSFDGGADNDTISGGLFGDTIQGGDGNDTLRGNAGNDQVIGGTGNDTYLTPTLDGADTFQGDTGIDTVDYTGRTAALVVDETTLSGDGQSGEADSILSDVDNITGGAGNDRLVGGGLPNVIHGAGGNDIITGGLGNDTLDGGLNNDTFLTPSNDGADVYTGGSGVDTISYAGRAAAVNVSLLLAQGDGEPGENDSVFSDMENVVGGNGNDTLNGVSPSKLLNTAGINTLNGGPGNDTLNGAGGSDTLIGGNDNDTFLMGTTADGADVIDGGLGIDTADYSRRTADLTFTLASGADDGAAGEGDNLLNMENLTTALSIPAPADDLKPPTGLLLVAQLGGRPVGCGALRFHADAPAELKRMWVAPDVRGLGLGGRLLRELEQHAGWAGATVVRLETNRALAEAINLYRRAGYREVDPFNDEPYAHHWFEKPI